MIDGEVFVDTNVLVYARDLSQGDKQARAAAWISWLWASRRGRVSVQVLNEYYVTVTRKLRPGLLREEARADVRGLHLWRPVGVDGAILERAWRVEERWGLSWWDALIVAAALEVGCGTLLSEDLQEGARFDDLVVVNPFRHAPPPG